MLLGALSVVEARNSHSGSRSAMLGKQAAPCPQPAVPESELRLVHALQLGVELLHRKTPTRLRLEPRKLAALSALDRVLEQAQKGGRSTADVLDSAGNPGRRITNRDDRLLRRLGDEQQRVAAGEPAMLSEVVAGDEHRTRRNPSAPELRKDPVPRVRLVGQTDLDVLRVARHPRFGESCRARCRLG
jgi:hypothetical protein